MQTYSHSCSGAGGAGRAASTLAKHRRTGKRQAKLLVRKWRKKVSCVSVAGLGEGLAGSKVGSLDRLVQFRAAYPCLPAFPRKKKEDNFALLHNCPSEEPWSHRLLTTGSDLVSCHQHIEDPSSLILSPLHPNTCCARQAPGPVCTKGSHSPWVTHHSEQSRQRNVSHVSEQQWRRPWRRCHIPWIWGKKPEHTSHGAI